MEIVKFCCCIKFDNFHIKLFFLLLHIFAQNMDSWYSIELPCTSSMYTAVNPMQCSYTESADQPAYQPSLVSIFFAVHSGRSRGGLFEPPFKIKPFHFHGEFSEKLGKKANDQVQSTIRTPLCYFEPPNKKSWICHTDPASTQCWATIHLKTKHHSNGVWCLAIELKVAHFLDVYWGL